MPTTYQVRVEHIDTEAKQGSYDAIELTGYSLTDNDVFKKKFFSKKKDKVTATKQAETAYKLNPGDWCEITLDDSSYHNVSSIKQIAPPAGANQAPASAPTASSQAPAARRRQAQSASDKMSKEEWAAKDRAKEESMARHKALVVANENSKVGTAPDVIIAQAKEFELYLLNTSETTEDVHNNYPAAGAGAPQQDDDIPF